MTAQNFSRPGAIDLSALRPSGGAAPPGPAPGAAAGGPAGPGGYTFDVTEQGFQTLVLEASQQHPVVLALWSSRAPESRKAVELISTVAESYGGRLTLARLDVDTSAELAQALQVRAVPYVLAVLNGQPVPLFEGSVDEASARQALDQVVEAAAANGITGRAQPVAAGAEDAAETVDEDAAVEAPGDPRFAEAEGALERGDTEQAVAAYRRMLDASPGDKEIAIRLAQAELVLRTSGVDADAARAAAAERRDDQQAQLLAADVDLLGGHVDDAFDRIIELVRRTAGEDRERARQHLVGLFDVVGDDPRVGTARRRLASALF